MVLAEFTCTVKSRNYCFLTGESTLAWCRCYPITKTQSNYRDIIRFERVVSYAFDPRGPYSLSFNTKHEIGRKLLKLIFEFFLSMRHLEQFICPFDCFSPIPFKKH